MGWSGEMLRKTYDRPQPVPLVETIASKAPVSRPRTQRGVIGPRCRADRVMVNSPPWNVRERAGGLSCPTGLGAGSVCVGACDRSSGAFEVPLTGPCAEVIEREAVQV